MPKQLFNFSPRVLPALVLCLFLSAACENPADENLKVDDTTKTEPEGQTENTWVEFTNLEQFPVTVYHDSQRQQVIIKVAANGTQKVPASSAPAGTAFYPTHHFVIEGVEIPYNSPGITARIDENKTNKVTIPRPDSISSSSAYIKIQNNSIGTITLRNGDNEVRPQGAVSTLLAAGETGVFQIAPGPAAPYSIRENAVTAVRLPASLTEFKTGTIYSFVFNGSTLVLDIILVEINIARMDSLKTLPEMLTWLKDNAKSGASYTLTIRRDEQIDPVVLSYNGKDVTITLKRSYSERTISLRSNGSLFTVDSGVTLVLENEIVLKGRDSNVSSLIHINTGGIFIMTGGKIFGNSSSSSDYGGGVYNSGTFTMSGGEISGNTSNYSYYFSSYSSYGGGVYNSGTFTMSGGEISGNTSNSSPKSSSYYSSSSYGGGVYNSGTFTMSGGEISGNTSKSSSSSSDSSYSSSSSYGGGVYNSGTFTMSGGEISGNTSNSSYSYSSYGGGVSNGNGTFRMSSGVIYGSTAATGLKNTTSYGASLYKNGGTTQYGVFSGDSFNRLGDLDTSNDTIRIVSGNLQNN